MKKAVAAGLVAVASALVPSSALAKAHHRVLRVGTYHGIKGQFKTIQAAVDHAKPNDWILIGPGDYKTMSFRAPKGQSDRPAGVLVTTRGLYIRGMDRNTVIVDGTKPGSAACSRSQSAQNFGPTVSGGTVGLNGILVWKANNVWVQNLTACNFLGGPAGGNGNEIWWDGGESGKIGGYGFLGSYLNATNTFFSTESTASQYGIFSSNWNGGTWDQTYASNFNDSGYYIGACAQQCNQTISHAWAEFNALGYSGSNSGGRLLIENSEFDQNKDGFDTNSQNGDNPPPQDGACPAGVKPPLAGAPTCWVFTKNFVHDNNNPNVPFAGSAGAGPLGTGMSVAGGRDDTIINNRFVNNKAWGLVLVPYPDGSASPCTGGTPGGFGQPCLYDEWGIHVLNNQFGSNGGYGHPSNGDIGQINLEGGHPNNCYGGNTEIGGGSLSADAAALQQQHPTCTGTDSAGASSNPSFLIEVLCDSQVPLVAGQPPICPSGAYPQRTQVIMHPLPPASKLKTMKNPCAGVPSNPWCPAKKKNKHHKHHKH